MKRGHLFSNQVQSLFQIGNDVFGSFQAYGQADQPLADAGHF